MSTETTSSWRLEADCSPRWVAADRIVLRVWAPHGERVCVQLAQGREVELLREATNSHFWSAEIAGVRPGDGYRLVLRSSWNDCYRDEGDELVRRDPYARAADFDSAWCRLTTPFVEWSPFRAPGRSELIIYELHVGSFHPQPEHDAHKGTGAPASSSAFDGVTRRLRHISELGFNTIQLMPVTEFGGIWGYNPRQLLAVHGPWGTPHQLARLVDEAHRLGMAVIVDLVLNHGSVRRNCLWNWDGYGPEHSGGIYFEGERDTPWGRRFAFHKKEVADYLAAACRMWIEEYNVDGLRFDSVHNMPWWLLQALTWQLRQHHPAKVLIAEVTPEDPRVVTDAAFDGCWVHSAHFDSLKVMRSCDGGESGHGRLSLLKSMLEMHPGFPRSSSGVKSLLGSHDQCGDRHDGQQDGGIHRYYVSRLGGRGNWHARAQTRMWYALQALGRGLPMIFMGTETLQDRWWHVDSRHRFDWQLVEGGDLWAQQMMRCVKEVNVLRLKHPSLTSEHIRFVHEDAENTVIGWMRWTEPHETEGPAASEALLCIANVGERQWEHAEYVVHTGWGPSRAWRCLFNSQAEAYGGWAGSGPADLTQSDEKGRLRLNLPKWSVLALRSPG